MASVAAMALIVSSRYPAIKRTSTALPNLHPVCHRICALARVDYSRYGRRHRRSRFHPALAGGALGRGDKYSVGVDPDHPGRRSRWMVIDGRDSGVRQIVLCRAASPARKPPPASLFCTPALSGEIDLQKPWCRLITLTLIGRIMLQPGRGYEDQNEVCLYFSGLTKGISISQNVAFRRGEIKFSRERKSVLLHLRFFARLDDFVGWAPWPAADPLVGLVWHGKSRAYFDGTGERRDEAGHAGFIGVHLWPLLFFGTNHQPGFSKHIRPTPRRSFPQSG